MTVVEITESQLPTIIGSHVNQKVPFYSNLINIQAYYTYFDHLLYDLTNLVVNKKKLPDFKRLKTNTNICLSNHSNPLLNTMQNEVNNDC